MGLTMEVAMIRLVPKRKVPARVRLADAAVLKGALYVAMRGSGGKPETVAMRLNDWTEKFLPFALEDRHLLLKKSCIVTIELANTERGSEELAQEGGKEFRLKLGLLDGTSVSGKALGEVPPGRTRALDYLNGAPRFIDLMIDETVVLVNGNYVVAVSDVFDSDLDMETIRP